jgi:hypothetical protein
MEYAGEMASCGVIYMLSFTMIGIGVKAILRNYLRNLSL